jgi:hypothetical protein
MAAVVRPEIKLESVEKARILIQQMLIKRLDKKGWGTFAGKHEILGILEEEYTELKDAIHNDKDGIGPVKAELIDIAVGCLFGVACIEQGVINR